MTFPTDARVEAAAKALHEYQRSLLPNKRSPSWDKQLPEFHEHMRSCVRAALAAAQAAKPEPTVEQIARLLVGRRIDTWEQCLEAADAIRALKPDAQAAAVDDRHATFVAGFVDFRDQALRKLKTLEGPLLSKGAIAYVLDVLRALRPPAAPAESEK